MARLLLILVLLAACHDDPVASATPVASTDADTAQVESTGAVARDDAEPDAENTDPYADAPSALDSMFFYCGRSEECIEEGACSFDIGDKCKVPDTPQDDGPCGSACRVNGLCIKTEEGCVATRDEHCRDSNHCFRYGICSLAGDRCVAATDADCEQSIHCEVNGLCSAVRGTCLAVDDDDCEKSCARRGQCHAVGGVCQALDDDDCAIPCRNEAVCKRHVSNVLGVGLSDEMTTIGTCGFGPEPPCDESVACRVEGRCGYRVTKDIGHPWRMPTGQCVATQEGCLESEKCKAYGACHPAGGECLMVNFKEIWELRKAEK